MAGLDQLSGGFFAIIVVWAIGAISLYLRIRKFPKYGYDDLKLKAPLPAVPERKKHSWIPRSILWSPLAVQATAVSALVYTIRHPGVYAAMQQQASRLLLWLNNVDSESFFIVPHAAIWMMLVATALIYGFGYLANLLTNEIIFHFFPGYLENLYGTSLGRMRRKFDNEWEKALKSQRSRTRASLAMLLFLFLLVGFIGMQTHDHTKLWIGFVFLMVLYILIVFLAQPDLRMREDELRKSFDAKKIVESLRRRIWCGALRAWVMLPVGILVFAYFAPVYTLNSEGVLSFRRHTFRLTPWNEVRSLGIQFQESLPDLTTKNSTPKMPKPKLDIFLQGLNEKFDLNEFGTVVIDPALLRRLIDLIREQNVRIACDTSDARAVDQLKTYLVSSNPSSNDIDLLYKERLEFFWHICQDHPAQTG